MKEYSPIYEYYTSNEIEFQVADESSPIYLTGRFHINAHTIQCPNCGGTLELGMDKCEYCGQVLLS